MAQEPTVIFKGGLDGDSTCPVCDQAYRNPMKLPCGHNACQNCLKDRDACSVCGVKYLPEDCTEDKEKHRQIQSLPVVCSYEKFGCPWQGELKDLRDHLLICPSSPATFEKCQRKMKKEDLEGHKCVTDGTVCSYCNRHIRASDMGRHMKTCSKVLISCPFQCGLVDRTREEVIAHQLNCPNVENVCPFVPFGCSFAGEKTSVQKHLGEEPIKHLVLLCDQLIDLKTSYDFLNADVINFSSKQENLLNMANTCNLMFGPQLVWKIDNIQQRMNEAKCGSATCIFSPAFMSHRHGYKMMASACLFGDGTNRGKYFSVYVLLLKGEFDGSLQWPFNRSVRFTLLDQEPEVEKRVNISYTVDPRTLTNAPRFLARPIGDRNASFGANMFCSLKLMDNYVKHCEVATTV